MHRHVCKLAIMILVVVTSTCHFLSSVPCEDASRSVIATLPSIPSPAVSIESAQDNLTTSQLITTPTLFYRTGRLHCFTFIETQWGAAPEEFGLCPISSEAWIRGPYPPVFSAQGDLFIVDKANQRIVRYSEGISPHIILLPSSYVIDDVCGYSNRWSNIAISQDRLFFLYSTLRHGRIVDQLAVLSFSGQEQAVIDLELYYPLRPLYLDSLLPDLKGGVYLLLPPAGIVHFDRELRPEFIYRGHKASYNEDLVMGWDGNLYTYNVEEDVLTNWGADGRCLELCESPARIKNAVTATQVVSKARLLGVDAEGRAYFVATIHEFSRGDKVLIRLSLSGNQVPVLAVGECPRRLAPDGSLWDIQYNPADPLIRPKVIRCVLD